MTPIFSNRLAARQAERPPSSFMTPRVRIQLIGLLLGCSWPFLYFAQASAAEIWSTIDLTRKPVSAPAPQQPESRFKVKIVGGVVSQRRELDDPFVISEAVEQFILGSGARSTLREQQRVTDLDERGRLELILVKLMYQLTDRIEVHAKLGTGRLVTRLDDLSGRFTVKEAVNSSPSSSTTFPFRDPDRHEGDGTNGFAGGVGFNVMLYQVPASRLSLNFGAQWLYVQSDDILKIANGAAIDESRTHVIDAGVMARQRWGRLTVEAGIGATWMLTVYKGYFTKQEEFFDLTAPENPFTTTTGRKRFSFDVSPEAFPIVGRLGFEYALTDSVGIQVDGAAGNSHTYSVLGGAFWRF
jgi:hypothetical protein